MDEIEQFSHDRPLEHFSHDHPLILRDKYMEDGTAVLCYGCLEPILGQFYSCDVCRFFLDKSCAQLPEKILHPSHPEHHLTLLPNPPNKYRACSCDVCQEDSYRFTYHCPACQFDVHVKCASMSLGVQQSIKHSCHEHLLMPLEKPISFLCDACATKHEDKSYLCTTCGLWVSQKCASLPTTIQLIHHHHPLTLFRSVPSEYYLYHSSNNHYSLTSCCKICGQIVYRNCWVYYCSKCSFFVHVNCATLAMKDSRDSENENGFLDLERNSVVSEDSKDLKVNSKAEDVVRRSLIFLPALDDSIDLTAQFMKDMVSSLQSMRMVSNKKGTGKVESWHVSHDHPLVFSDKEMDHELCSSTEQPPRLNRCSGCAKSISTPFYHCAQCNVFLHELCVGLPNKLSHPCHLEHPLLLTQHLTGIKSYLCSCCGRFCHTFTYVCSKCDFYLDCKCACLPHTIKHEAHKHELSLRLPVSWQCSICFTFIKMAFVCEACHLNVCARCALLPRTISHRYDPHPFTLTYSPIKGFEDQHFCEICLKEFTSSEWFYHCGQCNQSLHARCALLPRTIISHDMIHTRSP